MQWKTSCRAGSKVRLFERQRHNMFKRDRYREKKTILKESLRKKKTHTQSFGAILKLKCGVCMCVCECVCVWVQGENRLKCVFKFVAEFTP